MKQRKSLAALLGLLMSLHVFAQAPAGDGAWERAQLEMERNHWREAYDGFAQLADRGDVKAARMAYQMWLYAPMLYGQTFPARVDQVQRWGVLCKCTPVARARKQALQPATAVTP